ncbi:MAG: YciI family protein [Burkholderiaceae bacterium]
MEFVLTFHQPAEIFEINADPVRGIPGMQAWKLYMEAMAAASVLRGGNRLDAFNPTAVSVRDGKRQVQDGPFADTKDMLGGYVVIDVESLDEALKWAERCPGSAFGRTIAWPVIPMQTPAK